MHFSSTQGLAFYPVIQVTHSGTDHHLALYLLYLNHTTSNQAEINAQPILKSAHSFFYLIAKATHITALS